MTIPAINITVLSGGIGTIQPSNAKTHAKIGVCSLGTASVAASLFVESTTGGDGVTWTAVTAGDAGNRISIAYAAPSGGTTTVTLVGTAITVHPKTGATNTEVIAAVAGSSAALLVTGVATVGSDVVIAASADFLESGFTGTINSIISLTSPGQCKTLLGYGPLADAAAFSLQNSSGTVLAVPVNPSVDGTLSAVGQSGSGPVVTVAAGSGGPYDSYEALITIVKGGALATSTFTYSLDGGQTTSSVIATPGGGTYALPNTNITLTFASGTYVAAEEYNFSAVAPGFSTTDVANAAAVLIASQLSWNFLHLVGAQASVSASATMFTELGTLMSGAATGYRYTFAVLEVPADTDANIESAFASSTNNRVMACASTATTVCPVSQLIIPRSSAWSVAARAALVSIATDLGQVNIGGLPGITAIQRDEGTTPALDELGFTTLRTFPGLAGFYITGGHMKVAETDDFYNAQNRRVMDAACTQSYASLLFFLNSALLVNATNGHIAESSAKNIEGKVGGEVAQAILAPGFCSSTSVVVDRSNNVESTNTINLTTSIVPLAYAKTINETISFVNPGLTTASA